MVTEKTIRLTTAQALVKFLNQQYIEVDGEMAPFVDGIFTVFGHGNVVGIGQALEEDPGHLNVYQGKNEQGMAHAAIAYAKQKNRKRIYACSASAGPGSANLITAWHRTCEQFTRIILASRHIRNQTARPSFATTRA